MCKETLQSHNVFLMLLINWWHPFLQPAFDARPYPTVMLIPQMFTGGWVLLAWHSIFSFLDSGGRVRLTTLCGGEHCHFGGWSLAPDWGNMGLPVFAHSSDNQAPDRLHLEYQKHKTTVSRRSDCLTLGHNRQSQCFCSTHKWSFPTLVSSFKKEHPHKKGFPIRQDLLPISNVTIK